MKILLIAPIMPNSNPLEESYFPLGLAYISAILKRAGHEVDCINMHHLDGPLAKKLADLARRTNYSLVGLGGMSMAYPVIKAAILDVKAHFPSAKVMLGGYILSSMPEVIVDDLKIDYGVIGEGEETAPALAEALETGEPIETIPGLVVRDPRTGTVFRTPARTEPVNWDSLPFPDYDGFEFAEHLNRQVPWVNSINMLLDAPRMAGVLSGRSCPFQCTFCYHVDKRQERPLDSFFAEVDFLVEKFGVNIVAAMDEVLFFKNNVQRIYDVCREFKKRNLIWIAQLRVPDVNDDILAAMKDSGCVFVSYGIESVSPAVLKSMRKEITREQIETALELTYKHEMNIQGNLIFGDPAETMATTMEGISWWKKHLKYRLNLGVVRIYPDSVLYRMAKQRNLIADDILYISETLHGAYFPGKLNLTRMTDDEFARSFRFITESRIAHRFFGTLTEFGFGGTDSYGRPFWNCEVICPHCSATNRHPRLFFPSSQPDSPFSFYLHCRQCTRAFDIPDFRIWWEHPELPRCVFLTHYPPHRLLAAAGGVAGLALPEDPLFETKNPRLISGAGKGQAGGA